MPAVQSKLLESTCHEFMHPWTADCANSMSGVLIQSFGHSVKMYSIVYALSLLMRHKIPTIDELAKTILGILQSTAFLTTNGTTYFSYMCLLRYLLGRFTWSTLSFWPAVLSSFTGILIERPVRRPLLALYVSNVATETVWRMLESRGLVKSIPNGQALIFGFSVSILLYIYRLGLHKTVAKDSLFDILRMFVGKNEEGPAKNREPAEPFIEEVSVRQSIRRQSPPARPASASFFSISEIVRLYSKFVSAKHKSCPHGKSCAHYSLMGGLRPFVGGVGLQVLLKVVISLRKVVTLQLNWKRTLLNKKTIKLGLFLGGFSFLYKSISCSLRHLVGRDDPLFAIPAGLVGSVAFVQYPDITVACYVLWKMLQIVYNIGIEKQIVPEVPGFTIMLYCFSTAILFQAAIFEPATLRESYWKFLQAFSGHRVGLINRKIIDIYGLKTSEQVHKLLKESGQLGKAVLFPMA